MTAATAVAAVSISAGMVALTASPAAAACNSGKLSWGSADSDPRGIKITISNNTCGRKYRAVAHCDSLSLGTHYYYGGSVTNGTSQAKCSTSGLSYYVPMSIGYQYSDGSWSSYIVLFDY